MTAAAATARPTGARRGRLRPARWRVPRSLAVLVAVALVEALAWICVTPPFQGPDEITHLSYTQKIVETGTIPWRTLGSAPQPGTRSVSTEVERALSVSGALPVWGNPSGRPPGTTADERLWDRTRQSLTREQRGDGGFTSSMANPPAYYLYQAIPYGLTYSASITDREFAMRLANLPFLVVLVVYCWVVAGELLGGSRWLQTLATAAVALQPLVIHATATVNPDIALAAVWAAAVYVMLRLVRAGPSTQRVLALVLLVVLSSLTQPRGLSLLIPAFAAVVLGISNPHRTERRTAVGLLAGVAVVYIAGVLVLVYYATAGTGSFSRVRQFASYLWQFYLPRLPFMTPSISPDWGARQAFVDRLFGGYLQLEVSPSPTVLAVITWSLAALLALAVAGLVARRRVVMRRLDVVAVCALTVLGYLFVLHVVAFRNLLNAPDPILTGRYVLPFMALYGTGIALAISWLPRRVGVALGAVVLVGLTVLQVEALALVFERFYA